MTNLDAADNDLVAEIHEKLDGLIVAATELRAERDAAMGRVKTLEDALDFLYKEVGEYVLGDPECNGAMRQAYRALHPEALADKESK